MGPRSHERGNKFFCVHFAALPAALQWGRVLMNAETRCRRHWPIRRAKLQWGRVLMNAETGEFRMYSTSGHVLQWGRVLMNAETRRRRGPAGRRERFNGAAFS